MKAIALGLGVILMALQYRLWFGSGGVLERYLLEQRIKELKALIEERRERNLQLAAEVEDLKHNSWAVEERARRDLGMIGPRETYFMLVP
jgi:cell division protein FtsB